MEQILEIGEVGLLKNIPSEMLDLQNQNAVLTKKNNSLRNSLIWGCIAISATLLFFLIININQKEQLNLSSKRKEKT